jgi:hypothetical protein
MKPTCMSYRGDRGGDDTQTSCHSFSVIPMVDESVVEQSSA